MEKTHIFTHIKWEMRCFYIVCSQKSEQFEWVDSTRFDHDIALPTAFRIFWE
ncbi:MAG: NUDIX domain-containing protein [Oscillospiraceae bacterium]|nr:NUDIX domain-containing protein [Oscillospiraceae bacterium]